MGINKYNRDIISKRIENGSNNPNIKKRKSFRITIATMVKDEDDIITDWIIYYGSIFGFHNLYIIDNYSTDNTYKICQQFVSKGINLIRKNDYKKKGLYMTEIMNKTNTELFIPVDIDEFIIYYDHQKKCISINNIIDYLRKLFNSRYTFFKMNYINPIKTSNENGLKKFTHGEIVKYDINAKTFIKKYRVSKDFIFDHGNHVQIDNYSMTNLHLIHYHQREHYQVLKKINNNVTGLGYDSNNLQKLQNLDNVPGQHRISQQISVLKDKNINMGPQLRNDITNKISLKPIADFIN